MHFVILGILVVVIVFAPQWWARYVFKKYSKANDNFPGTGGELARHLLDKQGLDSVAVEITTLGDHYDPNDKVVRLLENNFNGKSLTAISIAAHEVGHAIQDKNDSPLLRSRTKLVRFANITEKIGSAAMIAMPFVTAISRSPSVGLLLFLSAILSLFVSTIVHLVTLPVEWNASFQKALPLLINGQYITKSEEKAVRQILKAAALTYVAASLASLLNLARWIAILRR